MQTELYENILRLLYALRTPIRHIHQVGKVFHVANIPRPDDTRKWSSSKNCVARTEDTLKAENGYWPVGDHSYNCLFIPL